MGVGTSSGLTSDLLLFATIDAAAWVPVEIAGCRKRNRDLINLLIANFQSARNAGVANALRPARGDKFIDAIG